MIPPARLPFASAAWRDNNPVAADRPLWRRYELIRMAATPRSAHLAPDPDREDNHVADAAPPGSMLDGPARRALWLRRETWQRHRVTRKRNAPRHHGDERRDGSLPASPKAAYRNDTRR